MLMGGLFEVNGWQNDEFNLGCKELVGLHLIVYRKVIKFQAFLFPLSCRSFIFDFVFRPSWSSHVTPSTVSGFIEVQPACSLDHFCARIQLSGNSRVSRGEAEKKECAWRISESYHAFIAGPTIGSCKSIWRIA